MKEDLVENAIITTLLFWVKKIKRGDCTREQEKAFLDMIDTHANILGTPKEIADFYGKSKEAAYDVIKRKYVGKPRRNIVMYSFSRFRNVAPKSWKPDGGHINDGESND